MKGYLLHTEYILRNLRQAEISFCAHGLVYCFPLLLALLA
jgi:hypothetical protein